jgi:hypothetical protein
MLCFALRRPLEETEPLYYSLFSIMGYHEPTLTNFHRFSRIYLILMPFTFLRYSYKLLPLQYRYNLKIPP